MCYDSRRKSPNCISCWMPLVQNDRVPLITMYRLLCASMCLKMKFNTDVFSRTLLLMIRKHLPWSKEKKRCRCFIIFCIAIHNQTIYLILPDKVAQFISNLFLRFGWLLVLSLHKEDYLQIFKCVSFLLHGCCGKWEGWALVNRFNHTNYVDIVCYFCNWPSIVGAATAVKSNVQFYF